MSKIKEKLKAIFGKSKDKKPKSPTREWVDAILFAVIAATIIRWLLLEAFVIPTSSMEKSLLVGDYLFVSKIHYGPRTPKTPLQIPLTHRKIWGTEIPSYVDWIQLPQWRLPGFTSIKRNDVIVFNYPMEHQYPTDLRENYIKRCIGMPGDVVELKNLQVYINGEKGENPPEMQFQYFIPTSETINERIFRQNNVSEVMRVNGGYALMTSAERAARLEKQSFINEVRRIEKDDTRVNNRIFPDVNRFPWNEDNFGPLWVPQKGITIEITPDNLSKYGLVIKEYEGLRSVEIVSNELFIDGNKVENYTFKQDYFFVMGDNRHNSEDSRFWGFVPEDHVVGKAAFVWLSLDPQESFLNKIRWNRIFMGIK
ncbi:MAG: signal peptidase I [Cyclobacteriaceae bacterium]|nr:signal peptidase I [Cyclobacteriaceae bacterium]MCH8516641.1 signal peptidase I [Cyclobacteriaceae bacterium]